MRLIDADELMKAMYHRAFETDGDTMWQSGCWVRYRAIEQTVKEQPTVDAEPIKHGKWENDNDAIPRCSECGYIPEYNRHIDDYYYSDYCPNCGAKMEEVEE